MTLGVILGAVMPGIKGVISAWVFLPDLPHFHKGFTITGVVRCIATVLGGFGSIGLRIKQAWFKPARANA
jgi:ACR3 family arsenite efflux pump ArsB